MSFVRSTHSAWIVKETKTNIRVGNCCQSVKRQSFAFDGTPSSFSHDKIYTSTTSPSQQHLLKLFSILSKTLPSNITWTETLSTRWFTLAQDSLMLTPQHSHTNLRQQWNSIHLGYVALKCSWRFRVNNIHENALQQSVWTGFGCCWSYVGEYVRDDVISLDMQHHVESTGSNAHGEYTSSCTTSRKQPLGMFTPCSPKSSLLG